jgi:hypothetical protein
MNRPPQADKPPLAVSARTYLSWPIRADVPFHRHAVPDVPFPVMPCLPSRLATPAPV